jgi:predicted deacetylase
MMGIVARSAAVAEGREPASDDVVDRGETAAEKFLLRWRGEADPRHVKAIDTYWICTAEHGLNASTFTARVTASTGADCGASLSSAVGALSGPLHGGAPAYVKPMLEEVQRMGDPERWVREALAAGKKIMGFGHRVYRAEDPRSRILKRTAEELGSPQVEIAEELEQVALKALQERHPERVQQIVAAGHELGHHGYTHRTPHLLSPDEEEDELVRAREILQGFGAEVVGYRSPGWDFSPSTLPLLQKHGFRYSSNFMDDLRPYRHEGTPIVELPVQWLLDDAPHFWFARDYWTKRIAPAAEVETIWLEELAGIRDLGGLCVFTMHPQVIGRPSRLAMLDRVLTAAKGEEAWIATCAEIAAAV